MEQLHHTDFRPLAWEAGSPRGTFGTSCVVICSLRLNDVKSSYLMVFGKQSWGDQPSRLHIKVIMPVPHFPCHSQGTETALDHVQECPFSRSRSEKHWRSAQVPSNGFQKDSGEHTQHPKASAPYRKFITSYVSPVGLFFWVRASGIRIWCRALIASAIYGSSGSSFLLEEFLRTCGSFRKLGVPYFGVLITRILLFRVPY